MITLIEDHHQALKIWREKKVKNLDLIHLDAHIDFGFHIAKPVKQVIDEARSVKDLKASLERTQVFNRYEKDFEKQTNIGNYIYPAIRDGIIKDFYWVIPGGDKEFKEARKQLKKLIKNLTRNDPYRESQKSINRKQSNAINIPLMGRRFVITTLRNLPIFNGKVLLDIDTDFLVVDSLKNASRTSMIGKRKPWIKPQEFVNILQEKVRNPEFTTIAYSVNGGFTPMKYKYLGDGVAYYLAPKHFTRRFKRNFKASEYFNLFRSTGKKEHYEKAAEINPTYRMQDNNYGPLYLSLRKFSQARDEFLKVLKVDPKNPACLLGLGNIALEKKDFKKAKKCFSSFLNLKRHRLFSGIKNQSLLGLANAEFNLKHFDRAKGLLAHFQARQPLLPQSYYLLGRILEKERNFEEAAKQYQDAIRLGFGGLEPISRLLRISPYLKEKDDIIEYIIAKYKVFKRGFIRTKRLSLKRGKRIKGLRKIEKKLLVLEKRIEKIKKPSTKRREV